MLLFYIEYRYAGESETIKTETSANYSEIAEKQRKMLKNKKKFEYCAIKYIYK